ncbi:MAG TPA: primosomal protein N' [Streptosporangiaceae bacterium]|nr:primosomal protein N' [Streptosporangiaceae bacterium]
MGDLPERAVVRSVKPGLGSGRAGTAGRSGGKKGARQAAEELPVARVAVDIPLPHLDRPFDYLVPEELSAATAAGVRVRVRFAGQLVDGFVLERVERSEHEGRLAFLERLTSPEPVLAPEIAALAREVADRYAGTLADVLRLAIPPRHARAEAEGLKQAEGNDAEGPTQPGGPTQSEGPTQSGGLIQPGDPTQPEGPTQSGDPTQAGDCTQSGGLTQAGGSAGTGRPEDVGRRLAAGPWGAYPAGESFLTALAAGRAPRAVWTAMPGQDWTRAVARAVHATLESGRGAVVVVADGRDVARVDAALTEELAGKPGGQKRHVALTAELGPAERYRRWLAVRRGQVLAVVGTRATMFAPVRDLGLVVLWDDGDDVHAEPHAPYPHPREVLALRAHRADAGALIGGFTRTTDATQLVESGWAHPLAPERATLRGAMPQVRPVGDDTELARDEAARSARLPNLAFRTARQALDHGPVLVQVPRRGYLPALACGRCRGPARCGNCQGPLALASAHAVPYCRWCGRIAGDWRCPECGNAHVRAVVVGAGRTAEELGRAFPGITIRTSGKDGVLDRVGAQSALIVSTPGAEPPADEGYAAALLLDGWALLGRADLRANEETLRRWMNAAALVRAGGAVVVAAEAGHAPVQALVRWDPVTLAERELAERRELGFPPAVRMASLTGTAAAVRDLLEAARLPEGAQVLGPVQVTGKDRDEELERALVRVPRHDAVALGLALKAAQGVRSARKAAETVRVRLDPLELI